MKRVLLVAFSLEWLWESLGELGLCMVHGAYGKNGWTDIPFLVMPSSLALAAARHGVAVARSATRRVHGCMNDGSWNTAYAGRETDKEGDDEWRGSCQCMIIVPKSVCSLNQAGGPSS